jgi:hypothetical protein
MWEPWPLATLWASTACNRDIFTFTFYSIRNKRNATLILPDLIFITITNEAYKLWRTSLCCFLHPPLVLPRSHPRIFPNAFSIGEGDSAVGIATGYALDGRGVGVRVPVEARFFSTPRPPNRFWGPPNPPVQWVPGALFRGKAAGAWTTWFHTHTK